MYILLAFVLSLNTFGAVNPGSNPENTPTLAKEWNIDRSHSAVNFRIRHFFTPVPGMFETWGGTIHFDPDDLDNSKIDIRIDVASINTKNGQRDEHLRTNDFFDAATFPHITFVSSDIRSNGENNFIAIGELTIKDVTETIELPFTLLGVMDHNRRPNTKVAGISAEYSLLRNDFGVGNGSYVQTAVIGNEVTIEIFLELLHQTQS